MFQFIDAQTNGADLSEYVYNFTVPAGGPERFFVFDFGCRAALATIGTDFVRANGIDCAVVDLVVSPDAGTSCCMATQVYISAADLPDENATAIALVVNLDNNAIRSAAACRMSDDPTLIPTPFHSDEDADPVSAGPAADLDWVINVAAGGSLLAFAFIGDVGSAGTWVFTGVAIDEEGPVGAENASYGVATSNGLSAQTGRAVEAAIASGAINLFCGAGIISSWAFTGETIVAPPRIESTAVVPNPTVTLFVAPPRIESAAVVFSPAVTLIVSPGRIESTAIVRAPVVTGGETAVVPIHSFDYVRAIATATRLITRFGQMGTIRRRTQGTGPAFNPGTPTLNTTPAKMVLIDFTTFQRDGTLILAGDKRAYVSVEGLTADLTPSDKLVEASGKVWTVVRAVALDPAGIKVFWDIHLRA